MWAKNWEGVHYLLIMLNWKRSKHFFFRTLILRHLSNSRFVPASPTTVATSHWKGKCSHCVLSRIKVKWIEMRSAMVMEIRLKRRREADSILWVKFIFKIGLIPMANNVTSVSVDDIKEGIVGGKTKIMFVLSVCWCDERACKVLKCYRDFFDLQCSILDEFPVEGGQYNKERTIPYLPGKHHWFKWYGIDNNKKNTVSHCVTVVTR